MFSLSNKKIIFLAVIFGLSTALAVNFYLTNLKEELNNVKKGQVVMAKVTIPAKTALQAEMLEIGLIPQEFIHPNAVTNLKDAIGKITIGEILPREQIIASRIVGNKDVGKGLSYVVPKGLRAISVGVNPVTAVSNLLQPGDRVDVVGLMQIEAAPIGVTPGGTAQNKTIPIAKVILQDIQILAVDQRLDLTGKLPDSKDKDTQENKTVTLAVKPEDAEKIVLVTERGIIRLILRSPIEDENYLPKSYAPKDFLVR